jgi:hypothetical protein
MDERDADGGFAAVLAGGGNEQFSAHGILLGDYWDSFRGV